MSVSELHNSRLMEFRNPQGALKAGESLCLSIHTGDNISSVNLIIIYRGAKSSIPMTSRDDGQGSRVFSVILDSLCETGLMYYYFELTQLDGDVSYYGGESGEGYISLSIPQAYQVTVYDKSFSVPEWFRRSIAYHIFPDRFYKGAKSNKGVAIHRELGRNPHIHESWKDEPDYLPKGDQTDYTPDDFFMGDLKGIRDKLEYFKSLNVGLIYLNPIFESGSNHRYDTADYKNVDPILGTNDELGELTRLFKKSNIRFMLDGVFSHTGADSIYFNKYSRYKSIGAYNSESSPYRSWYDFTPPSYRAWWGFPELPEVNELDEGYLDFLMRDEVSLFSHWAQHGITSWRLDVADELPDEFIKLMRVHLKKIDEEAIILGEVWEDASNKEAYGKTREYVLGDELDSVMNYPFRNALISFMLEVTDAHALNHTLSCLREHYPKPFYYALLNLISSHDIVRALTALSGAPDRNELSRAEQAEYSIKPTDYARQRLISLAAFQMAMPGVPCIYYGDEAGLTGMADPFNRRTFPWDDIDEEIFDAYRAYTKARVSCPALSSGYMNMGAYNLDVFAVLRFTHDGHDAFYEPAHESVALFLINRAHIPMYIRINAGMLKEGPDAHLHIELSGDFYEPRTQQIFTANSGYVELILPARGAKLLINR